MAEFTRLSGDVALDLLNTVEWRLAPQRRIEDLSTYARMLVWCREGEFLSSAEAARLEALARAHPRRAEAERDAVIALRERAYAALVDRDDDAAAALAEDYAESVATATLARSGDAFAFVDRELTMATPRHRIARGLVALLTRDDLDRLHQCEDDECGWVYLDMSPRRNRRWCATKDCGDRNRSRAYYARKKAAGAT